MTKVEDRGEHTLIGSGELFMDCVLRDWRERIGAVNVTISEPVVPFIETVRDTSAIQCDTDMRNDSNHVVALAQPLVEDLLDAVNS